MSARPETLAPRFATASSHLTAAAAAGRAAFTTSLSAEDMVITALIGKAKLPIDIIALDTWRLHTQTVALIDAARAAFSVDIKVFEPSAEAVAALEARDGAFGFYDSRQARLDCCHVRKVEPLARALHGYGVWITGQRRSQSATRAELPFQETDGDGRVKYNPLADWSWDEVLAAADVLKAPLNPLYAKGYVSIGCEPCTRAIKPGEDPRAGRWWWESSDSKECGLHVHSEPHSAEVTA